MKKVVLVLYKLKSLHFNFKILNNIWIQIRIIIQHQQNVSKVSQLLILDDDYLLNDMLVHVIDQQLKMLYQSLHVIRGQICYHKSSLSLISIPYRNGSDYVFIYNI